jgi:hypothetical protein
VGGTDNLGNDYADINPDSRLVVLYQTSSFEILSTSSQPVRFFFAALNLSMDRLFEGTSTEDIIYVADFGSDSFICGTTQRDPCESVEYALDQRVSKNGIIHIMNGVYGVNAHNFVMLNEFEMTFEGQSLESQNFPVLYPVEPDKNYWFTLGTYKVQVLHFERLGFLYPNSGFSGVWFETTLSPHRYTFNNCYFAMNISTLVVTNSIFSAFLGICLLCFFFFFFILILLILMLYYL